MRPQLAVSFLAAACCHALLLFGFKMSTPAQPLAMSSEPENVEVDLTESTMEPAPAATLAMTPEPESMPTPTPIPEPASTPPEASEQSMPVPKPTPQPRKEIHGPRNPRPKIEAAAHAATHSGTVTNSNAKPRYRSNPAPDYPTESRRMKQQGVVLLEVKVSEEGRPTSVRVMRSSGFSALDQAALQAVRHWEFDPARTAGIPVASRVTIPVRFSLSN